MNVRSRRTPAQVLSRFARTPKEVSLVIVNLPVSAEIMMPLTALTLMNAQLSVNIIFKSARILLEAMNVPVTKALFWTLSLHNALISMNALYQLMFVMVLIKRVRTVSEVFSVRAFLGLR